MGAPTSDLSVDRPAPRPVPVATLVGGGATEADGWRGNPAAPRAPAHQLCRHCGAPLATPAARDSGFCCAGCSYVHRLVHEHGLEGYYHIKDAVVPPVDPLVFETRDFTWLSELQAEIEKRAGSGVCEAVLEIQGISCAGCVWLIEKLFHQQPGAVTIEADAQLGRMRLRWERGRFDAPAYARLLQSFNYLAGPPGAEPEVAESRRLARRIGLCTAFAMNVMLFTLPVYFGMEQSFAYARLFSTLSFAFATFSLLAGGLYFITRAVRALREGAMHIDLPIAVGIIGAYSGSAWGWFAGAESFVYFDFVASFILLMLVGRWAQVAAVERNRRRLLSAGARPQKVRVLRPDGGAAETPVESLQPGDLLVVRSGQVVPVEGRLEDHAATIGTAWITGEAEPRFLGRGGRIPAGAFNLGRGEIRVRAARGWAGSLLAQLFAPAARDTYRHRFLERIVSGYLVAIFIVAVATGLGWWTLTHDAARTWATVTAVLVVSCPCAIGLAFPLADEMATTALRRFGVFVREADLWPRLGRVRKLVFDKTGTLTLETPVLENPEILRGLADPALAALLALVRDNPHPVSQCLYENLMADNRLAGRQAAEGAIEEFPGLGVVLAAADGAHWALGRPGWRGGKAAADGNADADTELSRDGECVAVFHFRDAVRPGAAAEIEGFRSAGFTTFILSGDRSEKVSVMAGALGIPAAQAVGAVDPEAKAEWLRRNDARDTLMLGDGANDSLAFDAAFARGTPIVHRGILGGKADFYYLGRGLEGLRRLFEVNRSRRRTQAALLVFSVAYNLLAVGLAVAGHMSPLLAAALMPISSLLTLAIVVGGMRRWLTV